MKEYLFVCRDNVTRSKYGAEFLKGFLKGRKIKAKVSSAGTGFISYFAGKRLSKKILKKVDVVFTMEPYMKECLIRKFNFDRKKIIVFGIKDNYGFLKRKNIGELSSEFQKIDWEKYLS